MPAIDMKGLSHPHCWWHLGSIQVDRNLCLLTSNYTILKVNIINKQQQRKETENGNVIFRDLDLKKEVKKRGDNVQGIKIPTTLKNWIWVIGKVTTVVEKFLKV